MMRIEGRTNVLSSSDNNSLFFFLKLETSGNKGDLRGRLDNRVNQGTATGYQRFLLFSTMVDVGSVDDTVRTL